MFEVPGNYASSTRVIPHSRDCSPRNCVAW
jgi:hypothetical protein